MTATFDVFSSLGFLVGVVFGATGYWAACRLSDRWHNRRTGEHRQTRIKSTWAAGGLLLIFMSWSMGSTARADENARTALIRNEAVAADAKAFAESTRRCQAQLLGALTYNRQVTTDNDDLSLRRFVAVVAWFHDLILPPDPAIAELEQNDPKRSQWAIARTEQAEREIQALIDEQQTNNNRRAPYPPPNCGG